MAKVKNKYEGETDSKNCSYACRLLVFALVTAVLFVGYTFSQLIG